MRGNEIHVDAKIAGARVGAVALACIGMAACADSAVAHISVPTSPTEATIAAASRNPEIIISAMGQATTNAAAPDDEVIVDIRILNPNGTETPFSLPDRIEAEMVSQGETRTLWLSRAPQNPARITLPPNGFAQAQYRLRLPKGSATADMVLSIPAWSSQRVMMAKAPTTSTTTTPAAPRTEQTASTSAASSPLTDAQSSIPSMAAPPPSDRTIGNAFSSNLDVYEPIYAVYGPGTNTEARIQISFKYRLFGSRQEQGLPSSWRDGLHFAYTQRMFWDLGTYSMPFRNVDYQPELFYLTPSATYSNGVSVAGQIGLRHESNGRDGLESRTVNTVYVAPMASFPVTGLSPARGYTITIAPRLSMMVGSLSDNPDIRRYRGNAALYMEIGKEDGWRLSTSSRFNFASGKGAAALDLSYPLAKLLGGGPDLYLFGQSFIGYGENLLDYNRHTTRFRIGVALIR